MAIIVHVLLATVDTVSTTSIIKSKGHIYFASQVHFTMQMIAMPTWEASF